MYLFPVTIRKSSIEGMGVFTEENIKKGAIVWKYNPDHDQCLSQDEYRALSASKKTYLEKVAYLSPTTHQYIFPPDKDPALYTNHDAKRHNLSVVTDHSISSEPYFIANRDISQGEELTNNYHEFDTAISLMESKPDWL